MYESHFGLSGKPFSLLPDSEFLFPSKRHRLAVNLLEYALASQAGFIVISGEVGTGKTTVIRRFIRQAGPETAVGVISNSSSTLGELMGWVAMAFEIDHRGKETAELYHLFIDFLIARYAEGKRTMLIIDEAQNLTPAMLEDLRMLSNVNNEKDLMLQIVLVGQPELLETLKRPDLRQFVQRIALHCNLDPLGAAETAQYIRHRLSVVGGAPHLFDDLACAAVHYFSRGIPRLINLLCDVAMLYTFSEDLERVGFDTVVDAAIDRGQGGLSPFQPLPDEGGREELIGTLQECLNSER
ncbi:ExeA family protein [Magnetospirillum fulvum]|uniref:Type II secretory pathway, component ExeA (Predicted ATPase) n=1 Tax=Magnetospirillum fulvum TaxID=1082 RepID=A0A1H6HER2_MAGFU|nr:AAA family ATPase [Magnetospirillum fulvum]SEH32638.1 Type II secretory pathway, component ExeA (predicted ATPase) [Magnetospirillum fulvum]